MSFRPCPVCKGARLKPEVLAVTVGDLNIHQFTQMSVSRAIEFVDELELFETERLIGERILKEIRQRLTFLDDVGVGYLQLDRAAATLSGGEAQRLRLAAQDRLAARRRALHPRRAVDRAPSARQRQADRHARAPARPRQHRARGRARRADDAERRLARRHGTGAGEHGGYVVAEAARAVEKNKQSITGQFLSRKRTIPIPGRRTEDNGWFRVLVRPSTISRTSTSTFLLRSSWP